jgi:hypothetical protein
MLRDSVFKVEGRVGLWKVWDDGWVTPVTFKPNQIQYDWGFIAAQTIGRGLFSYRIAAMYIEFENVASPGDPVTIPTFGRDEGTEYYDDLQSSGTRDFLRVPLLQDPMLGIATGFESYFTAGENGNKLTFFAQSQGTTGVHGKTFSDSVNSKVFGAALVATPTFADRTQDIIFARSYFPTAEQTLKEASSQIGISWEVSFK